ncbi:hypothetical protein HY797_03445, partial [Candidatus Falkowbacteria bacterium]|nr:hypothetical protein [Candidatus Falkowbacteria bacterium]
MRHQPVNENELIPLRRLAEISSYSPAYISLLVQRKKLKAKRIGRNFFTTKKWFNEYLEKHAQDEKRLSSREAVSPAKTPIEAPAEPVLSKPVLFNFGSLADQEKRLAKVFSKKIMAIALTSSLVITVLFIIGLWQSQLINSGFNAS